jgi:sulfite reductase (NADPH) hemoprotein beta-component
VGGDATNTAELGTRMGPAIAKDNVGRAVKDILEVYRDARTDDERLLDTFRRIGIEPFKERVYAETE